QPDERGDNEQGGRGEQNRDGDYDQGDDGDQERQRAASAPLAAAGRADHVTDDQAGENRAEEAEDGPGDELDLGGPREQGADRKGSAGGEATPPAAGGAGRAGGAGEHADRDAAAELEADAGERSHAENLAPWARRCRSATLSPMPEPPPRRRVHASSSDLERY